jgi:TorA maturation chaperone TorD
MQTELETLDCQAIDLAREGLYRFLAAALSSPESARGKLLRDPESRRLASEAADLLRQDAADRPAVLGFGELPAELLDLAPLTAELERSWEPLQAEYDRVFGLIFATECPPYETEFQPNGEPFFRSQQMADIAGFYRAFGLEPGGIRSERSDSIALELEFMAFVLMKKRQALALADEHPGAAEYVEICAGAEEAFFRDHLTWWVPSFATGLRRKASTGFYASLGSVLAALLAVDRCRFGIDPPRFPVQAHVVVGSEEQSGCAGCPASIG